MKGLNADVGKKNRRLVSLPVRGYDEASISVRRVTQLLNDEVTRLDDPTQEWVAPAGRVSKSNYDRFTTGFHMQIQSHQSMNSEFAPLQAFRKLSV